MRVTIQPSRLHAFLDYLWGLGMVMISFLLPSPHENTLLVCGISVVTYSIFTSYPGGIVGVLSSTAHAALDLLTSAVLLVAPWFLQGNYRVVPLVIGAIALVITIAGNKTSAPEASVSARQRVGPPSG